MMKESIQQEIISLLGQDIHAISPLSAANNAQIYRLDMQDGNRFVAKVAERGLDLEAEMTQYLRDKADLPVPNILFSNAHLIVMDYLASHHSINPKAEISGAEALAKLHNVTAENYGFEKDTPIATLIQPNEWESDWRIFFAEKRLLHVGRLAHQEGKIDTATMQLIDKLAQNIANHLDPPPQPGLIHGDIWSGNILFGPHEIRAFLDPAIYYADPEIEIAHILLFHTFHEHFFDAYRALRPLRPDFERRSKIYSLYPLLIHARLFGASYGRKAKRLLEKLDL